MRLAAILACALSASMLVASEANADVLNAGSAGALGSREAACASAKRRGAEEVSMKGGTVQEYGACQCAQNPSDHPTGPGAWRCNVDVYYSKN